jgi:methionyl-tRNA formyltransferase
VAQRHGIPVSQPAKIRDEAFLQYVRGLQPDLGVVVAFGRILPDALLAIPRLGMINVHASVLPYYRGAAPIQRAVMAGDAETGVTIMRVETELDAGPAFAVATVPIPSDATSGDMEPVLAQLGAGLLVGVVDDLAAGRAEAAPQDHSRATFAPKISKDEGVIDWTRPAGVIANRVRGLQPWPLASTRLGTARLVLRRTAPISADAVGTEQSGSGRHEPTPHDGLMDPAPGTVVHAAGGDLVVACGRGTFLRVLELQPEGRRTMSAREFIAGHRIAPGARFT